MRGRQGFPHLVNASQNVGKFHVVSIGTGEHQLCVSTIRPPPGKAARTREGFHHGVRAIAEWRDRKIPDRPRSLDCGVCGAAWRVRDGSYVRKLEMFGRVGNAAYTVKIVLLLFQGGREIGCFRDRSDLAVAIRKSEIRAHLRLWV